MNAGPLFLASNRGRDVVVDLACEGDIAALDGTLEPAGVRDLLAPWSLVAIREGGQPCKLHLLGWRVAEENTWITSALVKVDRASSLVLTSSGRLYRLAEDGGGLNTLLLDHLEYALRTWGFKDVR